MLYTRSSPKLYALLIVGAALLSACGGGGGGGSGATTTTTTTGTTTGTASVAATVSSGTISGLGSIILNGVRYETVGADVLDADDRTSTLTTPLGIGMTVTVEQNGTDAVTSRPIAGKIWVQSGIKGVARYTGSTLTVAGMPITVETSTILLDTTGAMSTLAALNSQSVEVYGLPQADGSFLATLVEAETGVLNVQLVGTVRSIDTTAKTLVLGTIAEPITVNFASITPPSGLLAGAVVVVKSSTSATSGIYAASSLRIRSATVSTYNSYASNYSGTTGVSSERNELYGAVSEKTSTYSGVNITGCTMKVQGIQVQVSSATLCASITNGAYVEVKGTLSNGVLNATKTEFEGNSASGYSDDWNDSDDDGLRYRSLSSQSTTTELQTSRSFEIYGTLSCSAVNVGCTLTHGAVAYTADLSSAYWSEGQPVAKGYVEAKGYLTGSTFKVTKIESKNLRYTAGNKDDADDEDDD